MGVVKLIQLNCHSINYKLRRENSERNQALSWAHAPYHILTKKKKKQKADIIVTLIRQSFGGPYFSWAPVKLPNVRYENAGEKKKKNTPVE